MDWDWRFKTCAARIKAAEKVLGILTDGQRVDLLLDNYSWIESVEEARSILNAIKKYNLIEW